LKLLERSAIRILHGSSLYETEPEGKIDQSWFLNQVVEVETKLDPEKLLDTVKGVEAEMGRISDPVGGLRIIDIDILLADDLILNTGRLRIPHPRLAKRNFVLVPLEEIAPDAVHPVLSKAIRTLRAECRDTAVCLLYK
jgi:2-amino-4-hydroxy-6-hydroxymethyldihydropteridine diphosphokinase